MQTRNLPASRGNGGRSMSPFDMLQDRIDRMFDDFAGGFPMSRMSDGDGFGLTPSLEMHEQDGKVMINAELPGVEEKDIDISADDDMLTISGEKRSEFEDRQKGSYRSERSFGRFSRSVRLPFAIDPAKVDARFDKGVLKLAIERPPEARQQMRRIEIRH
jgi:HSP20 family protein